MYSFPPDPLLFGMRRQIITGVASLSRYWLKFGANEFKIKNYEKFRNSIWNRRGGLLTVSNHISTLDDPLIWGALLNTREICSLISLGQMRWTVGAKELTFTNPFTSWFFERGQVIPIVRGDGIFQPAMNEAIQILNNEGWLHFFPEGKVIQYQEEIKRLKWGIGRLLMESKTNITVLPMFLKGFDLMKPNDLMPVLNTNIEIIIGDPIDAGDILKSMEHVTNEDEKRSLISKYIQDLLNETKHK